MIDDQANAKLVEDQNKADELYTAEFLEEVNNYSDRIVERNDYVNEFFLYFVVPQLERTRQLKMQNNTEIENSVCYWNYFKFTLHGVYLFFISVFYSVVIPSYVLLKYRRNEKRLNPTQSLAVIRSPATYSKMAFLKNQGVLFYADSLVFSSADVELSLYSQSFLSRLIGVFVIPWLSIKDFFSLFLMVRRHLGFVSAVGMLSYYRKRLSHKVTFGFYLSRLLKNVKPHVFYTGNKEDRFALIEKRLCHEVGIKSVCIPHGLEYSFKMPGGLVGDIFYCNSESAKYHLESLYAQSRTKFLFDENVVFKMLSRHTEALSSKKLVFFPESREPEKNLVIIDFLKRQGFDFLVKLHGKDSLENYRSVIDESCLVDDFDQAISNSICLARKSTVLLEAIYNHSVPIAILVDMKDRAYFEFMFPSLKDESILKVYSFDELKSLVKILRAQNVQ
ncbi:hypothetical protein [Thiomicrorhabdus xiamenensis]|uniref:Uncharacterized protein n=1 Tax=Thiomicrorhabdus xiamenensis TaxID=2739063 RepID=A0A7D4NR64_9GAMM|nr:hypothetical protein [Thiomicrorhabdus xiamenensis]QKI89771.1 hypothetical protein HQN79_09395 [Thiomicrorhabdus xiamenensis]